MKEGQLAFTFCQVPIVYHLAEQCGLTLHTRTGETVSRDGNTLSKDQSRSLFSRSGDITLIQVAIPSGWLHD